MRNASMRMAMAAGGLALIACGARSAHAVIVLGNGESVNAAVVFAEGSDRLVVIEDKLFHFESFESSAFAKQNFSILGFVSQNPNQFGLYNVGFDLVGPMGDGFPGDGMAHELNLQYSVAVLDDAYAMGVRLCDARLTFNGAAGGAGSYSRVDESIFDLDANQLLGQLSVFDFGGPPQDTRRTDWADFCTDQMPGYRAFEVNKDIKFLAAGPNGFSTASFVRQEFSQVPSPGALALLMLAGLSARRRRA